MQNMNSIEGPSRSATKRLCAIFVVLTGVGVAGCLLAHYTQHPQFARPAIIFASACYVGIALAAGALRSWYGRPVVVALLLCLLGDCIVAHHFMAGLSAYLWSHSVFMAAFAIRGIRLRRFLVALLVTLLVTTFVVRWILPYIPRDQYLPVFAYLFAFSIMLVFAGGSRPGPAYPLIVLGSVLFYIADIFFAQHRFISPGFVTIAIAYTTYYLSCVLFALSVLVHKRISQGPPASETPATEPADAVSPLNQSAPKGIISVLTLLTILGVAGFLLAKWRLELRTAYACLVVASSCYVLIAMVGGASRSWYGALVLIGLLFCWLGDCIGPYNFVAGLVAFVFAHIAFMPAFCVRGLSSRRTLVAMVLFLAIGCAVFRWLYPYVRPDEQLPIFAYMIILTAMIVLAAGVRPAPGTTCILLAAVCFYISDILLARSHFVAREFVNTAVGYPLYYAACLLFAFSAFARNGHTGNDKPETQDALAP